ncbi:Glycosyltransferase [hydrothermal vent metagenome]|uniref:Glycosyltransferase n=1 Tax=hydrothermal vent metagenome TaxID=652676 RepID=A0A3B0S0T8_9ZZZZ
MRIVQIIPRLEAGGAERTTLDVSNAILAAGGSSLVLSRGGPLTHELTQDGGEFLSLAVDRKNPLIIWQNITAIAKATADFEGQILHARSRAPAWSARAAAQKLGLPFVTTYHGTYDSRFLLKRKYNSIMASGDLVIANSKFIARHIEQTHGINANRIRVIARGIDMHGFDPAHIKPARTIGLQQQLELSAKIPVIVMPGRLTRRKGQLIMLDALAQLFKNGRKAQLVLPGNANGRDDYASQINRKIEQLGLQQYVRLPGHIPDMAALYALADLVICASVEPEAFGRVAVEAQAAAKPVIATAHGGALETIEPGISGLLVTPGDATAITEAITEILDMPAETREKCGRNGQARVQKLFSLPAMCRSTLQLYAELLR